MKDKQAHDPIEEAVGQVLERRDSMDAGRMGDILKQYAAELGEQWLQRAIKLDPEELIAPASPMTPSWLPVSRIGQALDHEVWEQMCYDARDAFMEQIMG